MRQGWVLLNIKQKIIKNKIEQRAKEGWRYVGYIPILQRGNGYIEEIDLVFEKEG